MSLITTGIDVGSSSVKCVAVKTGTSGEPAEILASRLERLRRRDPASVVDECHGALLHDLGIGLHDVAYVATTGEGDWIPFRTGHFYGMTTHARGGLFLEPEARGVIDVGALHARAILMDPRSRVLGYRMTSQCASGSGQFLENIARYLGVSLQEVGELSLQADAPEKVSSICAVLSETDVINMVSRGIRTANILKGIHLSMGERYAKLLRSAGVTGTAIMTGGLAADVGLAATIREELRRQGTDVELRTHPMSVHAGALGAALWGAFRREKLARSAEAAA
jgi:benzoyl-CoA reductase subunit D